MKYEKYAKLGLFGVAVLGEMHDGFHKTVLKQSGFCALLANLMLTYSAIHYGSKPIATFLKEIERAVNKHLLFSENDFRISNFTL